MTRRAETLLIVALALAPALAALHSRSFFSPDETSYTEVAREMLETRDFTVPTIDGKPWLEKPPLAYWLLAGSFALLGWGFPAAVLLNALLTAGTALVVAAHARRWGTDRGARLAAAAYLTMFLPLAAARSALTDPALTLCTTAAVALFLVGGIPATLASGALLGLGILAKGPVAPLVVIPAFAAVAWARRDAREAGRAGAAAVAAAAVALPWHLALASRGLWHEFTAVFLGRQVLSRAVDAWGIGSPWWFYAPVLWVAAFPWGTHLVLAGRDAWRRLAATRSRAPAVLAEAAAVAVPLAALSLSANKFPHYLLPVAPWLAVWLGRAGDAALGGADDGRLGRAVRRAAPIATLAALGAVAFLASRSALGRLLPSATAWWLAAAGLVAAALGVAEARGRRRLAWAGLAAVAVALRLAMDLSFLPALDGRTIERPLAAAVRAALPPGGAPIAHRWWRASFVAYGVRGWRRTDSAGDLHDAVQAAAREARIPLVLVRSDAEGEARAALWNGGGVAREVARVAGVGELAGTVLEGIVFLGDRERDGTRWFFDGDRTLPGESGFDGVEGNPWTPSFRWSVARAAHLPVAIAPGRDVRMRLQAWGPSRDRRQSVRLEVNGIPVAALTLGAFPEVHQLRVPSVVLRDGLQDLAFAVEELTVPAEHDAASRDRRTLAFALDWIAFDPEPDAGARAHPTTSR